jgi:hypothetical protein
MFTQSIILVDSIMQQRVLFSELSEWKVREAPRSTKTIRDHLLSFQLSTLGDCQSDCDYDSDISYRLDFGVCVVASVHYLFFGLTLER